MEPFTTEEAHPDITTGTLLPTEEEITQYLDELQRKTTLTMVPSIVYLVILSLVGLVGNSLVVFVYSRKFTSTPTRIFILSIASFDLITNVVVIPGEIYDIFHLWNFDSAIKCKLRLFLNAFTTMVAAMVLVAVAVTRYRKICRPFGWQITEKNAKVLSIVLAAASLLFSTPYAIINGRQTKQTPRSDIHGYECTVDDSYVNTMWPMMNAAFFIFLFVVCSTPLVVLYILIGVQAWKHSKMHGARGASRADSSADKESSSEVSSRSTRSSRGSLPVLSSRSKSYVRKESAYSQNPEGDQTKLESGKDEIVDKQTGVEVGGGKISSKTRAPNGEMVSANMFMVRELTVKLNAAQKRSASKTSVTFKEVVDDIPPEINHDEFLVNVDSEDQVVAAESSGIDEDGSQKPTDAGDNTESKDLEGQSDFSKAMQWIDITYCPDSHADEPPENCDTAPNGLFSKKFSIVGLTSIRLSRENSLIRKHRNFRDTLTDTLARARKNLRDRDAKNNSNDDAISEAASDAEKPENEKVKKDADEVDITAPLPTSNGKSKTKEETENRISRKPSNAQAGRTSLTQTRPRRRGMGKTTIMLLIISIIYVMGFLPYLGLAFFKSFAPESFKAMDEVGESLYNLFLRSYFLNCAANPIIYSLCDINFRKECLKLLRLSNRK